MLYYVKSCYVTFYIILDFITLHYIYYNIVEYRYIIQLEFTWYIINIIKLFILYIIL